MTNIFFDLDGTLIDSRIRIYVLFKWLALNIEPNCADRIPEFEIYWQHRRSAVLQKDILLNFLNFSQSSISKFKKSWLEQIEEDKLLALDTPFAGVSDALEKLSKTHALHMITARQYPEKVHQQIAMLNWTRFFTSILVTRQQTNKADLIKKHVATSPDDIFFGDTSEDMHTAHALNIKSVAVDSGFVALDVLRRYNPSQSYKNVCEAVKNLTAIIS